MSNKNAKLRPKQNTPAHALKRADGSSAVAAPANPFGRGEGAQAADRQFEVLFSTNPLAMYICHQESLKFLEVNAAALRQYGYTREEFLGMKITQIRPNEDVPGFLNSLRQRGPAPPGVGQMRHRRKNGEIFSVKVTSQKITFAFQDAVLVVAQDVSEQMVAEQKLAEHTAFMNALTENNPLAIVALDLDRRVQMCNPAFEALFGYILSEIAGKELESLIAPRGGQHAMTGLMHRVMGRRGRTADRKAAAKRWVAGGRANSGRSAGGGRKADRHVWNLRGHHGTRTRRRSATPRGGKIQANLRKRRGRIFRINAGGAVRDRQSGDGADFRVFVAGEMIREVSDIGRQLYADPEARTELQRRLEQQDTLEGYECPMLRRDGTMIWVSMNVRAVRDASGKIISHDGTAEDVTERKRSELIRQVTTEIIHAVSVTENLDALLRLIHASLGKVLDASNCFVALRDAATGKFYFPFFVDRYDAAPAPDEMQDMDRSCTSYVFRTEEAAADLADAVRSAGQQGRSRAGRNALSVVAWRSAADAGGNDRGARGAELRARQRLHAARS